MSDQNDPFAGGDQYPSVKFPTVGASVTGIIAEAPSMVQGRDFESGELASWPDGNPKMVVVVPLIIGGERHNLWAPKPSALFAAIQAAKKTAGDAPLAPGGTLTVTYTHETPNEKNPRLNPTKQFSAVYQAPDAFADGAPATVTAHTTPVQAVPEQPAAPAPAQNPGDLAKTLIASGLDDATIAATTGLPVVAIAALRNVA
jgi:hypothetical protein